MENNGGNFVEWWPIHRNILAVWSLCLTMEIWNMESCMSSQSLRNCLLNELLLVADRAPSLLKSNDKHVMFFSLLCENVPVHRFVTLGKLRTVQWDGNTVKVKCWSADVYTL